MATSKIMHKNRARFVSFFGIVGFVSAALATAFLRIYFVGERIPLVLGFQEHILYFFPLIGATVSIFWAALLYGPESSFGKGAAIAFLSFVMFCVFAGLVLSGGFEWVLGFLLFGFILIGWATTLLGGISGWIYRKYLQP